ncbi:MAG TPA: outer membrane beta-barrel protein [Patescibacteria group bacterium]|nr:outer membrane beta-barrel protein [Patescibacteria group bacterium]
MKKMYALFLLGFGLSAPALAQQEEDVLRPRGKSAAEVAEEKSTSGSYSGNSGQIAVGVEAGINYNMFAQDIERSFPIENSMEDAHLMGSGVSPFGAIFIDFPLTNGFGIQVKGIADFKSWSNTKRGDAAFIRDNDPTLTPNPGVLEGKYSASAFYIGIAALLRIDVGNNLFFTVGPTYHALSGEVEREDRVEIVEGAEDLFIRYNYQGDQGQFRQIERTTTLPTSFILPLADYSTGSYNTSRLGIEAGVGYKINMNNIWLVPQFRYNHALSNVASETTEIDIWQLNSNGAPEMTLKNSRLNSLQFSIALMFNL